MARYTGIIRRTVEYVRTFDAATADDARAAMAAFLNVDDNGHEIETNRPPTVKGFRIRGESYTLATDPGPDDVREWARLEAEGGE